MIREYITIEEQPQLQPNQTTKVYEIKNKKNNVLIGYIRWYSPWRKFCLFPVNYSVYDTSCLNYINEFINAIPRSKHGTD
jgi:hypothetical protein